ncbi:permease [candidate division KSB1 bacterium]
MDPRKEWKPFTVITAGFLALYFLPIGTEKFSNAVLESLLLVQWYAREHVILCLVPAFLIAGAIAVFISKNAVIRYLGSRSKKTLSYGIASVSGAVLAVCSCTILPLFAGIYRMGAGLGPATAFLYAGPAINVLAVILTARILGAELGIARAVCAVVFSIVIGLLMELFFGRGEKSTGQIQTGGEEPDRPLSSNAVFFALMIMILVLINWSRPETDTGIWFAVYSMRWIVTGLLWCALSVIFVFWFKITWWKIAAVTVPTLTIGMLLFTPVVAFSLAVIGLSVVLITSPGEPSEWFESSWGLAKQIAPLLFAGVLVSGLLLGRTGHEGIVPAYWIERAVGGNSLSANLAASVAGALMYFATLTEVPILEGLINSGMGKGPALSLLLAGPALSLPNMLVIRSIMGARKTLVFVALVVIMATVSGMIFGIIAT